MSPNNKPKGLADNSYNKMKMKYFCKGLKRAIVYLHSDGDSNTSIKDIKAEIQEVAKEWDIKEFLDE